MNTSILYIVLSYPALLIVMFATMYALDPDRSDNCRHCVLRQVCHAGLDKNNHYIIQCCKKCVTKWLVCISIWVPLLLVVGLIYLQNTTDNKCFLLIIFETITTYSLAWSITYSYKHDTWWWKKLVRRGN